MISRWMEIEMERRRKKVEFIWRPKKKEEQDKILSSAKSLLHGAFFGAQSGRWWGRRRSRE